MADFLERYERYGRVAEGFGQRVRGCGDDQWDAPSPCPDWSARDVVVHVVNVHRRTAALLDHGEAQAVSPDEDLPHAWLSATSAVSAALADEARASTVVPSVVGELPWGELVGQLLCADTLIHTWDLARATGQDDRLDEAGVAAASDFLTPLDEAIRQPDGFGPKLAPPEGADAQAKLLAFLGRAS